MTQRVSNPMDSKILHRVEPPSADGSVPKHVAIIMDGSGRWATSQGKPRSDGHRAGTGNIRRIMQAFERYGVKYFTLFAFSTENWSRPNDEVQTLINILAERIDAEVVDLHQHGVKIRHLGRLDRLPQQLQKSIQESVELTKDNDRLTFSVAFDYGGRAEILNAVKHIVAEGTPPEEITEEVFEQFLYTSELPDPDLIIRTSGEMRLSNFLLWQAAYAEFYATDVMWPDFGEDEVAKALAAYSSRKRRFGSVNPTS